MTQNFLSPSQAAEVWASAIDPDAYQVLALDPGGTTGWAVFQVHPDAITGDPEIAVMDNVEWWTAGEIEGKQTDQLDELVELIGEWPAARLVTEQFKVRSIQALLDPAEINAALAWAVRPRYFVYQNPDMAMKTVTDDRQKSWGYWIPGKEHARDAVKHAITFLKRRKEQEVQAAQRLARINRRAG